MSDKLFVRRRILAFLMVFVLFFSLLVFLLPNVNLDANAETNSEFNVSSSGEISNDVAMASGLSDIPPEYRNKCVEMTDSDEFEYAWNGKSTSSIKDYPGIYNSLYATAGNGPYVLNRDYSYSLADRNYDDPIGEIVPIELMQKIGVYTYFGKEYGFFINTYKSPHSIDKNIHSLVFVFDITYSMRRGQDGNPDGCVTVNVEPVFQYRYVYLDSNNSSFRMYDYYDSDDYANVFYSINKNVIRPHPKYSNGERSFDYQDIFYLKDVSVGMTLFNEQALNPNDKGYSYENDNGAFFIMAENEYSGRVLKDGKLTTDDKLDVASHVLGSVLDVVAFGANIIAPGSGTLIEILDVAGGLIDVADGARLWTNVSQSKDIKVECYAKKATFNCLYANKIEQINNYGGKTVKSMAVTNNSDNNNSIWYGQGDHYRAIFGINAEIASGQQFPNTRAFVECALKIVDKKGNVYGAQNAVNKTVDNETYQESIDFAESKNIYLLPNGYNCFSFVPYYSGKYIFNFDFNNSVKIEVDGEEINGNSVDIVKDYTPNAPPVKIKIKNNGDAVKGKLLIDVSSINETTDLIYDKDIILKVNVKNSGFYKISTNNFNITNSNIVFVNRCSIENGGFGIRASLFNKSQTSAYLDNNTYFVVKKTVNDSTKMSFNYKDVDEIGEDKKIEYTLSGNVPVYFKFVTDNNKKYKLSYSLGLSISARVYDSTGKEIGASTSGTDNNYNNFSFNSRDYGEVYINFFYSGSGNVNYDFMIFREDSVVRWFVDGVEVPGRIIEVERGKSVAISAKINDTEIDEFNCIFKYQYTFSDNLLTIATSSPFGLDVNCSVFLKRDSEQYLTIIPVFERKVDVYLNEDTWKVNFLGGTEITEISYSVNISDEIKTKTESYQYINNENGELDKTIDLKAIITNIIYNKPPTGGWRNDYLYIDVVVNKIKAFTYNNRQGESVEYDACPSSHHDNDFYFFNNGNGTQNNPYLISSKEEFNLLGFLHKDLEKNLYFKQTVDLSFDKNNVPKTETRSFYGYMDGNGHTLTVSYEGTSSSSAYFMSGLFTSNYGTICNYSRITSSITSVLDCNIGGIVSYNYGTISNIMVDVNINNIGCSSKKGTSVMGGIVAENNGIIKNVTVNAYMQSCSYYVGGIAGQNYGVIEQCNIKGTINLYSEKTIFYAGSIAGESNNKISSCSSSGSTISYKVSASDSRTLAPRIGAAVGLYSGGTLLPTGLGTVNRGTLKTVTWWEGLKKKSHNQAEYVGNIYGQCTT